jgi:hypothetical protein
MKKQIIDLNYLSLTELTRNEMSIIEGGGFLDWVEVIGLGILVVGVTIASGGLATTGALIFTGAYALDNINN